MKTLYTAKATAIGEGRGGQVYSADGAIDSDLSVLCFRSGERPDGAQSPRRRSDTRLDAIAIAGSIDPLQAKTVAGTRSRSSTGTAFQTLVNASSNVTCTSRPLPETASAAVTGFQPRLSRSSSCRSSTPGPTEIAWSQVSETAW